jgi:hypothetical protein
MRLSLIVAIAVMMTLTASAADVSGTWKGTIEKEREVADLKSVDVPRSPSM